MNTKLLINLGLCGFQPLLAQDTGVNGGSTEVGETGTDTTGTEGTNESEDKQTETKTFDDILKDKSYQSEFDKRIFKSIETAKSKWETDYNSKLEAAKIEAEKLAKMDADEKAKYEQQKKDAYYEKREKDITARELRADAYETLAKKGFDAEQIKSLIPMLNYSDAEACNESIENFAKVIQQVAKIDVQKTLKGGEYVPPKGATNINIIKKEDFSKMSYKERVALKQENPALYEELAK